MIEIPVLKPPDILADLPSEFRPIFDRRQYRQFCRYITASWASSTRSVAHLNGISVEHTNQSNMNRFLRNVNTLDIFRRSVDLINRYCSDPVLVLDDTVLQRSGKHIQGAGQCPDRSRMCVIPIQSFTAFPASFCFPDDLFLYSVREKEFFLKS